MSGRTASIGTRLSLERLERSMFAYHVLALWLPMPLSLGFLPTRRMMAERRIAPGRRQAGHARRRRKNVAQRETA